MDNFDADRIRLCVRPSVRSGERQCTSLEAAIPGFRRLDTPHLLAAREAKVLAVARELYPSRRNR